MRGHSACNDLIHMRYGMFDDIRLKLFSKGEVSFLNRLKEFDSQTIYTLNHYNNLVLKAPKFKYRLRGIA